MRHLHRHANTLAQRRVRVNRFTDVHGIRTHLNRQRNLANHVARIRADHAADFDALRARPQSSVRPTQANSGSVKATLGMTLH